MKKMMFLFALTGSLSAVKAQTSFGVHANGIISNVSSETTDDNGQIHQNDTKSLFSWKAGVVANIPINSMFTFMPQLNILSKGAKVDMTSQYSAGGPTYDVRTQGNIKLTYLELPLFVVYNTPGKDGGFFGGVGPVLSYGMSGKSHLSVTTSYGGESSTDVTDVNVKFDGKKDAQDDDMHLKAFEFGVGAIAGYRLSNGLFFNVHYNLGLSNIDPDNGNKTKTNYGGIGIGYFFNKK